MRGEIGPGGSPLFDLHHFRACLEPPNSLICPFISNGYRIFKAFFAHLAA
jgi:hypothetical protein